MNQIGHDYFEEETGNHIPPRKQLILPETGSPEQLDRRPDEAVEVFAVGGVAAGEVIPLKEQLDGQDDFLGVVPERY